MTSWIKITPRFHQGLEVISKLDIGKFRLLVNHICQELFVNNDGKIFSEDEEEKLITSLSLEKETLNLLIDIIILIYSQAAFSVVKPAVMENTMKELFPLSEESISVFVNAWITHGKRIIDTLRQKSIFPNQVENINWSFNIQAASSSASFDNKMNVLLQLAMTGKEKEKLTVEMDKSSLSDLFENLEKIQNQLDALK
ncbi:COMM domain-containing protein 10 [Chelonus insularis]|uniref:COMM domain-containing protein 10 n=1 Tax=Chelonus insularis TaxID=460826 RepID=UPI00158C3EF6|nr:COMM domain-containing protein 10-like [Chelonus insularis]XP_034935679.1 COMM domain-containing protein 10-like [Chelonus insularis]